LTCAHRSQSGVTCGDKAACCIDGKWLCVIHAQIETVKKGAKQRGGR